MSGISPIGKFGPVPEAPGVKGSQQTSSTTGGASFAEAVTKMATALQKPVVSQAQSGTISFFRHKEGISEIPTPPGEEEETILDKLRKIERILQQKKRTAS